ncbi:MAG: hypothetical protein H7172_07945 [Ferruginibacter sp.]|nr:hypothetical protein [Rhodoferax sp.]
MQTPPVERTVNWPSSAAGTRSGVGSAATQGPDTRPVTVALQQETTQREAASAPTPSVKLTISATQEDIAKLEAAAPTRTAVRAVPKGEAAQAKAVKAVGGLEASTPTVATPAVNQKVAATDTDAKPDNGLQNESPETLAKAAKLLDAGKQPGPDQPLAAEKTPSTDWTTTAKAVEQKPENPPPEPMSKKLLDFLQLLWRSGGSAIDVAQVANQTLNPDKLAEGPLTYKDPTAVKKTTGV